MKKPVLFLALISLSSVTFGQTATSTPTPVPVAAPAFIEMPSNPKEYLQKAATLNGLTGADIKPWHLKATFDVYDDAGKVKDTGTYEELWVSPTKYKQEYTFKGIAVTQYGTENGIYVRSPHGQSWDLIDGKYAPSILRIAFIPQFPDTDRIKKLDIEKYKQKLGDTQYTCLSIAPIPYARTRSFVGPTYCFNTELPMLHFAEIRAMNEQVLYYDIQSFHGHYIASYAGISFNRKAALNFKIEALELIDPINDAEFNLPPDARRTRITVAHGVMDENFLKKVEPMYPAIAKAARVQGTVILEATIDTTGKVKEAHVTSGPPMLQQAAIDNAKQWFYKPYLLNGEPVEVETTINVVFNLNK